MKTYFRKRKKLKKETGKKLAKNIKLKFKKKTVLIINQNFIDLIKMPNCVPDGINVGKKLTVHYLH